MSLPSAKKQKTTLDKNDDNNETSCSTTSTNPLPLYGTKEYWEDRYKTNRTQMKGAESSAAASGDELPEHAWYFSYEDLRPILLPLLLGNNSAIVGESCLATATVVSPAKDNEQDGSCPSKVQNETQHAKEENSDQQIQEEECGDVDNDTNNGNESAADNSDEEDEEDDTHPERPGVPKDSPVAVLEVGCGDVPLGTDLATDLNALKESTGIIVNEIICCDYSPSVIDVLQTNQQEAARNATSLVTTTTTDACITDSSNIIHVEYAVADARKMPYPNGKFHLLLEKGTLDAMLSDKEHGQDNCIAIVTDCARVLAVGGYMVIVSHLNAHTEKGICWLEEVIMPGLNAGGGGAKWEIEVHGNDCSPVDTESDIEEEGDDLGDERTTEGTSDGNLDVDIDNDNAGENDLDEDEDVNNDDDEDDDDSNEPPSGSPGPAVYVIHKKNVHPTNDHNDDDQAHSDASDLPTIPVEFFSY